MYTLEIFNTGLEYLGITDPEQINALFVSCAIERDYILQMEHRQRYRKRFIVPRGLDKKEYKIILEETQIKLNELKPKINAERNEFQKRCLQDEQAGYINKKEQLKKYMKPMTKGKLDVARAKAYPMDELIDFKNGVCLCLWHNEKTPSMHHNKKNNTVHCFGACGTSFDTIDVYQKLNNCDFKTAVNALQ